jgi:hypothetical protein
MEDLEVVNLIHKVCGRCWLLSPAAIYFVANKQIESGNNIPSHEL